MQRPLSVSQSLHSPHCLYIVLLQVDLPSFSASEVARSLSLYRLCGKLGLSITCFRFGKIPPPTSFSLARRFWVFFWCYLWELFWEAALLVWRFWIMILKIITWRKSTILSVLSGLYQWCGPALRRVGAHDWLEYRHTKIHFSVHKYISLRTHPYVA